jgi:deazaflavin-dependent oxidoreductase (nitroreductase family)
VAYLFDSDGGYVVGGGAAGMARVADWVLNIRANPSAVVTVNRKRVDVTATELEGPAREYAHQRAREVWKSVDKYEYRSGRAVPYFHLQPSDAHRSGAP